MNTFVCLVHDAPAFQPDDLGKGDEGTGEPQPQPAIQFFGAQGRFYRYSQPIRKTSDTGHAGELDGRKMA
ncbi:MAG: hypothetical protein D6775_03470 [Caldilineae bacterium]|nr:MAG: hypothetical protein D6775_03470 [Caldilineae bacterium]